LRQASRPRKHFYTHVLLITPEWNSGNASEAPSVLLKVICC
jgi:hypothetical protein